MEKLLGKVEPVNDKNDCEKRDKFNFLALFERLKASIFSFRLRP